MIVKEVMTGDVSPVAMFLPTRIMYAARDISETVGCLGLITSSIISKKVYLIYLYIESSNHSSLNRMKVLSY